MNEYHPDRWVILEIINPKDTVKTTEKVYKVLAGWYGGYANGDSYRTNSGITKIVRDGDYIHFHGYTKSVYTCHKDSYGMSGIMSSVYASAVEQAEKQGVQFRYLTEKEVEELSLTEQVKTMTDDLEYLECTEEQEERAYDLIDSLWDRVHNVVDEVLKNEDPAVCEFVRLKMTEEFRFWERL